MFVCMYVFKASLCKIHCLYLLCFYVCMYVCSFAKYIACIYHVHMYVCMYGIGSVYLHRYSFLCWSGVHLLLMRAVQFARPNFQQLFVVSQVQSSSMYVCMYVCMYVYIHTVHKSHRRHIDGWSGHTIPYISIFFDFLLFFKYIFSLVIIVSWSGIPEW